MLNKSLIRSAGVVLGAAAVAILVLPETSLPEPGKRIFILVALAGVFLSALVLKESYSGWVWMALALMIGGLALVQPRESAQAVPAG